MNFREDWEFLVKNEALPEERMRAVETGGCPHAAIREVKQKISGSQYSINQFTMIPNYPLTLYSQDLIVNSPLQLLHFFL